MPRIRKLQPSRSSRKLGECFKLLQSGASGECLAGELGCCGDSCCSSALVSRALAEYCQHSDAAREAFVSAKGIDALQAALVRGSPSAAAAAARVLGALCGSSHGLRCVLRWQSTAGSGDLLSTLAVVAGGLGHRRQAAGEEGEEKEEELQPELRAECVEALRCALGALHGPAAGGGLELAGALQVTVSSPLAAFPGDFLTRVALPPLLSANANLRAAAARLIAAAAEEGVLAGGAASGDAAAVAATLSAALGLSDLLLLSSSSNTWGGPEDSSTPPRHLCVLALCELVAALLEGAPGAVRLLEALRGPSLALALSREVVAGSHDGGDDGAARGPGAGSCNLAGREALLDVVLLCLRQGPHKLWAAPGEECQLERRAFVAGAARLATLLLSCNTTSAAATADEVDATSAADAAADAGGNHTPGWRLRWRGAAASCIGTAAALASALASWPQAVLRHEDLRAPGADLLSSLGDAVTTALRGYGGPAKEPADSDMQHPPSPSSSWQPAAMVGSGWCPGWRGAATSRAAGFGNSDWHVGGPGGGADCGTLEEAATLRGVAAAAAAAVRLYGAAGGEPTPSALAASGDAAAVAVAGDAAADSLPHLSKATAVAQCLGRLLQAARDCRAPTALLAAPLEALLDLPDDPLESLFAARTVAPSSRAEEGGFSLPVLAVAAATLAEGLLAQSVGDTHTLLDASASHAPSSWAGRADGGSSGYGWRTFAGRSGRVLPQLLHVDGLQRSAEQHAALLVALRVWARLMTLRLRCECKRVRARMEEQSADGGSACDACAVRPMGPLGSVVKATESLWAQKMQRCGSDTELSRDGSHPLPRSTSPRLEDTTGIVDELSSSAEQLQQGLPSRASFAGWEASRAAVGCDGWEDQGAQLLKALACTLGAAVSSDIDATRSARELRNRMSDRLHRLAGYASCHAATQGNTWLLETIGTGSGVGTDGGYEARARDSDADPEADLADADAILDECLACIGPGLAVP